MTTRRWFLLGAIGLFVMTAVRPLLAAGRGQDASASGCVERDAATSTPVYKLVVKEKDGSTTIYYLNAPGNKAVPAAAGKVALVSGTIVVEKRGGREVRIFTVKTFKVVADRCE
jgi:hypothetical protein